MTRAAQFSRSGLLPHLGGLRAWKGAGVVLLAYALLLQSLAQPGQDFAFGQLPPTAAVLCVHTADATNEPLEPAPGVPASHCPCPGLCAMAALAGLGVLPTPPGLPVPVHGQAEAASIVATSARLARIPQGANAIRGPPAPFRTA